MSLNMRQDTKLEQQLRMTPQLQQSIQLLLLTRAELEMKVSEALQENPLLEIAGEVEGAEQQQGGQEEGQIDGDSGALEPIDLEALFSDYERLRTMPSVGNSGADDNGEYQNQIITYQLSLDDALHDQLLACSLEPKERLVAEHIVGNLSTDGYLKEITLNEIAYDCNHVEAFWDEIGEYPTIDEEDVQRVLLYLQDTLEPAGVGARNLTECLKIQIRRKNREGVIENTDLLEAIVEKHLTYLETKNYKKIAKLTRVTVEDVMEAARWITQLEPSPGRSFQALPDQFITPDIYIDFIDGEYVPRINDDGIPKLRIASYYQQIAQNKDCDNETKSYILEKARGAKFFIDSIYERQNTIYKVTESIIKFQKRFFEEGVQCLRPLVLRDIADDIGMHESTVSRVTTNKYVETPRGIFELKFFFNSTIENSEGDSFGSEAIRAKMKELIDQEDRSAPLSDAKIASLLEGEGVKISRRTVAKYREGMGILSSKKRKQVF